MYIGAHISASGGVQNAPLNALKYGCECYQFFSRSPRGGKAPELTKAIIEQFKNNNNKNNFKNFYIHSPYYINLASQNNRIYHGSIEVLRSELERGTKLGVKAMMFHIGSSKDLGASEARKKVIQGLKEVLTGYAGTCQPLLEISAGTGLIIGDTFEEIVLIIKEVEKSFKIQNSKSKIRLGVCFDTCHAFASGYDLRDEKAVKKTFGEFDKIIRLDRLVLIHANDSMTELNSHRDRHAHLGQGKIGKAGFQAMLKYIKNKKLNIDFIVETPTDTDVTRDIKLLKKFRG